MLSKGLIKLANSLNYKKYREIHQLFIAEGEKLVSDLIKMGAPIKTIISVRKPDFCPSGAELILCKPSELEKIGFLKNTSGIVALVKIIENQFDVNGLYGKLSIGLDGIQDPGNMGTIIRLANWFGIEHIVCSTDCVDIYNPKVVQATMGALIGVKIDYVDLPDTLDLLLKYDDFLVYGTYMEGKSIYQSKFKKNGILIMGNEGKGISEKVSEKVNKKLSIPAFYSDNIASESLNVAVATGIIISEFCRQSIN